MRRIWVPLAAVVVALVVAAEAAAAHLGGSSVTTSSGGFPWETVLMWSGIGVGIVLIVLWAAVEGRRHHWHMPHRPLHA